MTERTRRYITIATNTLFYGALTAICITERNWLALVLLVMVGLRDVAFHAQQRLIADLQAMALRALDLAEKAARLRS